MVTVTSWISQEVDLTNKHVSNKKMWMDLTYSKHAKERIKDRDLDQETVSKVIQNPDTIVQE